MPETSFNPLGSWLDAGLGTLIEAALHRLLAEDQPTLRRLATLEGKQLQVCLSLPPLQLVLRPHAEGIGIGGRPDGVADAKIEATLPGMLRLLQDDGALAGEGVVISGDTSLAAELREILRQLDIDWEALLANQIGDLPAHPLAQGVRGGWRWLQRSGHSLLADLDNYLHEELAVVPARPELEHYYREVDDLRLAADRLQARVVRLERQSAHADGSV